MNCQWQSLLNIIPPAMRREVDEHGRQTMQELRMRVGLQPELVLHSRSVMLDRSITQGDILFCLNAATKYSPWTSESIKEGYITAVGGHRIGVCGHACYENGDLKNVTSVSSLCIRVARDFKGISKDLYKRKGSLLIIGSPGFGKTTLLRDLIRSISEHQTGAVTVLDERRELFPVSAGVFAFERGVRTDVMSGVQKRRGMEMALRTMGPSVIAVDEITNEEDCLALQEIANCGVRIIATAHASGLDELKKRTTYEYLLKRGVFDTLVTLHSDKSWEEEGLINCILN